MDNLINKALKLAEKSQKQGEFPVSAIIYKDDKIVSCGYNRRNRTQRTTDHAEIIAIQKANKKLRSWRLNGYSMLVTLEPCDMCKNVIMESRLDSVQYLVKRYEFKKMCKNSKFELLEKNNQNVENYKVSIKCFFDSKR